MKDKLFEFFRRFTLASLWVYLTLLFVWVGFYFLSGDKFGYVGLINSIAIYLYIPLPFVLVGAVVFRRRELWFGFGFAAVVFIYLWGSAFLPKRYIDYIEKNSLSVMTYNVLGSVLDSAPLLDVIKREEADVVLLQEVNPLHARVIQSELEDIYPYQILDPQDGVRGMGTLSKYPIRLNGNQLDLGWIGVPQLMELEWGQHNIAVVNFHMWSTGFSIPKILDENFRNREAQAAVLVKYADRYAGPLIIAGDANTSPMNDAYKIISQTLVDSWEVAGYGLGHTFPGSDLPGGSRPRIGPWPVPMWMTRIDYVFTSNDWRGIEAHLAPFDDVSDHRGVVVELVLISD